MLLPVPDNAGPWGYARFEDGTPTLVPMSTASELSRQIESGDPDDPFVVWGPNDTHLRTVFEVPEIASAVESRGRRELDSIFSASVPKAALAILLIVAGIVFWPEDRSMQSLALLVAIVFVLPLWREGVEAAWDSRREGHRLARDPDGWRAREAGHMRFSIWTQGATSRAAAFLVGAFVLLFGATLWAGRPETFGRFALIKPQVADESWRLLTCAFLHANFVHIFFNSAAGLSLANVARVLVDEATILLAFVVSVLAASVTSYALSPQASVGASGGILGWGGLLLGMALARKELRGTGLVANMTRWVVLIAAIGLAGAEFIDNAAHAGGFAAGLALGVIVARRKSYRIPVGPMRLTKLFWVLAVALAGVALWMLATLVLVALG